MLCPPNDRPPRDNARRGTWGPQGARSTTSKGRRSLPRHYVARDTHMRTNLNFTKRLGTKILNKIFFIFYKKKILDIQCGLRAFNTCEKKIKWSSAGLKHYFADAEITCNAVKNKCAISQIPIRTLPSDNFKGMNIVLGLYLLVMIVYWRLFNDN